VKPRVSTDSDLRGAEAPLLHRIRYVAGLAAVMTQGHWPRVTGHCDDAVSARHGEEAPGPGDAFEFVFAAVGEVQTGTDHKRRDRS
jgi:hypothetical protein